MTVRAWRVHDTGLVAVPGRFRRLPGQVRHHQRPGPPWPDRVELVVTDGELAVSEDDGAEIGRWPVVDVVARRMASGPPVHFVLEVDGAAHLLAAAADPATDALLADLAPR